MVAAAVAVCRALLVLWLLLLLDFLLLLQLLLHLLLIILNVLNYLHHRQCTRTLLITKALHVVGLFAAAAAADAVVVVWQQLSLGGNMAASPVVARVVCDY